MKAFASIENYYKFATCSEIHQTLFEICKTKRQTPQQLLYLTSVLPSWICIITRQTSCTRSRAFNTVHPSRTRQVPSFVFTLEASRAGRARSRPCLVGVCPKRTSSATNLKLCRVMSDRTSNRCHRYWWTGVSSWACIANVWTSFVGIVSGLTGETGSSSRFRIRPSITRLGKRRWILPIIVDVVLLDF